MRISFVVLSVCATAFAAPSPRSTHVVHERRAAEPVGWAKSRRLEAEKVLPLRIGLKQQNLDGLDDLLMFISHPDSPNYGQHWSPNRVVDHFSPSNSTVATVKDWLTYAGLSSNRLRHSVSKGWIEVNATVAEVEELLSTEYHVYTHTSGVEQIGKPVAQLKITNPLGI